MTTEFLRYVGSANVHDATVERVIRRADEVDVIIQTSAGRVTFEFHGIKALKSHRAEGMLLYSISEMSEEPPYRRFCFVNSDENDSAELEVVAQTVHERSA